MFMRICVLKVMKVACSRDLGQKGLICFNWYNYLIRCKWCKNGTTWTNLLNHGFMKINVEKSKQWKLVLNHAFHTFAFAFGRVMTNVACYSCCIQTTT